MLYAKIKANRYKSHSRVSIEHFSKGWTQRQQQQVGLVLT